MASRRRSGGPRQGKTEGARGRAVLERRLQWALTSEPDGRSIGAGFQTGGAPQQPLARQGTKFRAGAKATAKRRREIKRAPHKSARRANEMMERRLERGLERRD